MDTLVALGSAASYVYSIYALFAMTDAQVAGDMDAASCRICMNFILSLRR